MKAVCIIGSPRENGSTAMLVRCIAEGMKASGIEVHERILSELNINYCKGCRHCASAGRCIQQDDMNMLIQDLLTAEIVVLASPSYWGEVTGQMKVFIDRSLPLCNVKTGETSVPKGKIGVGVAVRAGHSKGESEHLIETFHHYFGHLGIKMVAQLTVEGVGEPSDLTAQTEKLSEAFQLGSTLIPSVTGRP
jgi:multimeric flavodoxin WrbA